MVFPRKHAMQRHDEQGSATLCFMCGDNVWVLRKG